MVVASRERGIMEIAENASVWEAYEAVTRDCIVQIIANERRLLEPEDKGIPRPECLHKMRVGVRRLRTARSIFKLAMDKKTLKHEEAIFNTFADDLKWLQMVLGRARDWDVLLDNTIRPLCAATRRDDDRQDLMVLIAAGEQQRERVYQTVLETLRGERYRSIKESAETIMLDHPFSSQWKDRSVVEFADYSLHKRANRMLKHGKHIDELDPPQLHELRKMGKKLRYGVDFFASLYTKKQVHKYHDLLVELQDAIGGMVDTEAGQAMLHSFPVRKKKQKEAIGRARKLVTGWMLAQSLKHFEDIEGVWTTFVDLTHKKPVWEH